MDITAILISVFCALSLYLALAALFETWSNRKLKLPPGPYGIPLLGYIPFLGRQTHLKLTELGKKYGSVFSMQMGKHLTVVLHDWSAIKAALVDQGDIFAGRPRLAFSRQIRKMPYGIIPTDGDVWKTQRRFALSKLRDFGFGKRSLANAIQNEVDELCSSLEVYGEQGIEMKNEFFIPMLNVIWGLVAGKHFDQDDPNMVKTKDKVKELLALTGLHYSAFLPNFVFKFSKRARARMQLRKEQFQELASLMKKDVEEHRQTLCKDDPRDLIDMYLIEMEKQKESQERGSNGADNFSENHLLIIAENFFLAGVDTTNNTLSWGIHFMVTWPEIQNKVQEEMDLLMGRERGATLEDRDKLPYTNAVIMEIQRYASIAPLAISHRCMKSTTLLGYHIPQDTVVIPNLWNLSRDPKLWGDPENFRPERFLDKDGKIAKPDYFVPFSLGPRVCLGESLAKMELFLFFTNLLHRFRFERPPDAGYPNLQANFALTLTPPKYSVICKKRL